MKKYKGPKQYAPILRICGTTRGVDDEKILEALQKRVQELNLEEHVEFKVNMAYPELL